MAVAVPANKSYSRLIRTWKDRYFIRTMGIKFYLVHKSGAVEEY